MRLLLDTHVFLWAIGDTRRLSSRVRGLLEDAATEVMVSVASAWEIAIAAGAGRLDMPPDLKGFLTTHMTTAQFQLLPISIDHAIAVRDLQRHHRDPFDRLLIAQSRVEGVPLVSRDRHLEAYDVDLLW